MTTQSTTDGTNQPSIPDSNNPRDPVARSVRPLSGPFGLLISIALLSSAGYLAWRTFSNPPQEAPDTVPVMYICSETGKTFAHVRRSGEPSPVLSPFSKKNTGYPAEKCYWTKDGKIKDTPTYVLLNEQAGKPGPTKCPDCGRLVVPHNPRPRRSDGGKILVPSSSPGDRGMESIPADSSEGASQNPSKPE
ncbi:MAG: hypothetical protein KF841_07095 [Phycisphaerae bacterium]|nr:hypothetical protein [Phycisphaerae bacterium]